MRKYECITPSPNTPFLWFLDIRMLDSWSWIHTSSSLGSQAFRFRLDFPGSEVIGLEHKTASYQILVTLMAYQETLAGVLSSDVRYSRQSRKMTLV